MCDCVVVHGFLVASGMIFFMARLHGRRVVSDSVVCMIIFALSEMWPTLISGSLIHICPERHFYPVLTV